jgi:hypothetical protein
MRYCDSWENDCPVYGSSDSRGIAEITGGLAGEVYVGYWGVDQSYDSSGNPVDPDQYDPNRHTGQVDRVQLNADGSITVTRLQMVSSNNIHWWHDRTIMRLVFDHLIHHNELLIGTNHGVDRFVMDKFREPNPGEWFNAVQSEWMGDHLHPVACVPPPGQSCNPNNVESSGTEKMGEWRGLALDANGDLWVGGRWSAGKILWVEGPWDWTNRTGSQAFAPALGLGNKPVFPVASNGDPASISAVSVAPDGNVWWASGPWYNGAKDVAFGVARTDPSGFKTTYYSPGQMGLPEQDVRDLVVLPDGRIVLASNYSGLSVYDPATQTSTSIRGTQYLPSDHIYRLELDTMVTPWTLHVSTAAGAASLQKLP